MEVGRQVYGKTKNLMWGKDHRRTSRPWGYFTTYMSNQKFTVKDIVVRPGQGLSLQTHKNRDECWAWIDGPTPRITIGDYTFYMEAGREYAIPRGTKHRIENVSGEPTTVLEVSYGKFDEDDITRLEDYYGRA